MDVITSITRLLTVVHAFQSFQHANVTEVLHSLHQRTRSLSRGGWSSFRATDESVATLTARRRQRHSEALGVVLCCTFCRILRRCMPGEGGSDALRRLRSLLRQRRVTFHSSEEATLPRQQASTPVLAARRRNEPNDWLVVVQSTHSTLHVESSVLVGPSAAIRSGAGGDAGGPAAGRRGPAAGRRG
jgi:hypothetical protein